MWAFTVEFFSLCFNILAWHIISLINIIIFSHPLIFQSLLYKIISGVHSAGTDAASSSYAPAAIATKKSVGDLLSEIVPMTPIVVCVFFLGLTTLCLHVPILLNHCATYFLLVMQDSVHDEDGTLNCHDTSNLQVI